MTKMSWKASYQLYGLNEAVSGVGLFLILRLCPKHSAIKKCEGCFTLNSLFFLRCFRYIFH